MPSCGGVACGPTTAAISASSVVCCVKKLLCLSKALTSDREPVKADIRRDRQNPDTECRMNAGFVKIYSVL